MIMRRDRAHYSPPRRFGTASAKSKRGDHYNGYGTQPAKSERKSSNGAPRTSNKPCVNSLKTKIRDLTRLLNHNEDLPAGVRIEKERALAGYRQDLENAEQEKRTQAMITRYHKVRFFERQKATRHVKKARKCLEASEPGTLAYAAAHQDVHIAEVDLKYTLYCPLDQKYEGIYPREASDRDGNAIMKAREHGNGGETEQILASRPAMWKIVENCMKNGTLEALRNGKLTTTLTIGSKKPASAKAHSRGPGGGVMINFGSAPKATKTGSAQDQDSGDESDGGFFEKRGGWKVDQP